MNREHIPQYNLSILFISHHFYNLMNEKEKTEIKKNLSGKGVYAVRAILFYA